MGRAKQYALEQYKQGFDSMDTHVCSQCIENYALRDYIEQNGNSDYKCSYCHDVDEEQKKITISFDQFIKKLLAGIRSEWGDPNNEGVPWEKGWQGKVYDSWDLLTEQLEIGFNNNALFTDIASSLTNHQWCQKNFYELQTHQALVFGWDEFTKVVKHESRYVFLQREDTRAEYRGREEIPPSYFLDALGTVISECNLYSELKAGTLVCRLRAHETDKMFTKAHELGSPPPDKALYANRMSAAGISAFYCAFDKQTAIAETATSDTNKKMATLGYFELLKNLCLVDFTKLPEIPSIFEPDSHLARHGIKFLRHFLYDFTKSIKKDGRENIDYVPTQIVAEYLRFIHLHNKDKHIDGILYPSAQQKGANACVIFIGPDAVCDYGNEDERKIVRLNSIEKISLNSTEKE